MLCLILTREEQNDDLGYRRRDMSERAFELFHSRMTRKELAIRIASLEGEQGPHNEVVLLKDQVERFMAIDCTYEEARDELGELQIEIEEASSTMEEAQRGR
jgi:hypothetical protein